jgi:DGQHR domain-containing protein
MLATQIRQKDGFFYFISYAAEDLLRRVRFISRFYDEGAQLAPQALPLNDEIAAFISRIEKTDQAFQRDISKAKVKALKNFYETADKQPPIPGTVLLFTKEQLSFKPLSGGIQNVGNLQDPSDRYLIIDGQHRLAALQFYLQDRPEEAATIHVPCIIFDGKSEDFATEMFVIINSTPTRINKSHLVDLYEKVSWSEPDKKLAARITEALYSEGDSPLRYRINRLGGRSQKEKWILQAELFNEVHRWVKLEWTRIQRHWPKVGLAEDTRRAADHYYRLTRDFLKAAKEIWGDAWGHPRHMVTKPVTLKAMLRVCADLAQADANPEEERIRRWRDRISPWRERARDFRAEGFYERFPAKGQVERVGHLHRELLRLANIEPRATSKGRGRKT